MIKNRYGNKSCPRKLMMAVLCLFVCILVPGLIMNLLDWTLFTFAAVLAWTTAGHALLNKRDPRAALGWMVVCFSIPLAGPLFYFLFGINRVCTRAKKLQTCLSNPSEVDWKQMEKGDAVEVSITHFPLALVEIARISGAVTELPLVGGNEVEILHNGEQTYPAMLREIENAKRSVFLSTYIFETNSTGRQFIETLAQSAKRGVDIRVMLDGAGEFYSLPRAGTLLRKCGVRVGRFLPPKLTPPSLHINLRNHRKVMVVDGKVGFTGGMNIGDRHLAENRRNPSRVIDAHFRLTGPIVTQMELVFLEDWRFITGEDIVLPPAPSATNGGGAICRTIADGPNEDLDKLALILVGAVSSARWRVSIMTPYFLPSREMISALQTAALRGVEVSVILPSKNNLPYIQWATNNMLWELLQRGVRVYFQPPPFVHTKLFLVDDHYVQIGSANIDPRSLRLNFEVGIEVYDKSFAEVIAAHFQEVRKRSSMISLRDLQSRSLPIRIRDGLSWLLSPYL